MDSGCEKPEPQTTSQGPNPTAPQASSDLLRDTQQTQGSLQCVHFVHVYLLQTPVLHPLEGEPKASVVRPKTTFERFPQGERT